MRPLSLLALRRAIRAKSEFVQRVRETPPESWDVHVPGFLRGLRNSGLRDRTALVTLLTVLLEELPGAEPPLGGVATLSLCRLRLQEWLQVARQAEPPPAAHVDRMREFIEAHYTESISLARLSFVVGREKGHLATLFRKSVGCPVRDYLARVRVQRAAELIRQGQKIESAMLFVGYRSKRNFYEQFARAFGFTPGSYRRRPPTAAAEDGAAPGPSPRGSTSDAHESVPAARA